MSASDKGTDGVRLTANESYWLVKMSTSFHGKVSVMMDKPPRRTMNSLVSKGMAVNIMDTYWAITEVGRTRCTTIY
jgi:hypothetical protein